MRNKIIIVEGPDCCGKSTLVEAIQKQEKGIQYFKEDLKYQDRLDPNYNGTEYYRKLALDLSRDFKHYSLVIDRFHIGEFVNPIVRKDGRAPLDFRTFRQINDILSFNHDVTLVTCLADDRFIRKAITERGEDIAEEKDFKYLKYLYELGAENSFIKKRIIYNAAEYTKDEINFFLYSSGILHYFVMKA